MGGLGTAAVAAVVTIGGLAMLGGGIPAPAQGGPPPGETVTGETVPTQPNPIAEGLGRIAGAAGAQMGDATGDAAGSAVDSAGRQLSLGTVGKVAGTAVVVGGGIGAVRAVGVGVGQGVRDRIKGGGKGKLPDLSDKRPSNTTPPNTTPPLTTPLTSPVTTPPRNSPPVVIPRPTPPTSRPTGNGSASNPLLNPPDLGGGTLVMPPGVPRPGPMIPKPPPIPSVDLTGMIRDPVYTG